MVFSSRSYVFLFLIRSSKSPVLDVDDRHLVTQLLGPLGARPPSDMDLAVDNVLSRVDRLLITGPLSTGIDEFLFDVVRATFGTSICRQAIDRFSPGCVGRVMALHVFPTFASLRIWFLV